MAQNKVVQMTRLAKIQMHEPTLVFNKLKDGVDSCLDPP